jgi:para-aminobenzoate synthetase / 4-amino-4-deoxychorismate lyase
VITVLIDDSRLDGAGALLFERPSDVITAMNAHDLEPALARLTAALADGQQLAGYFAYDLGFALEPKLTHLLRKAGTEPLLEFGVFDAPPQRLTNSATDAWLAQRLADSGHAAPGFALTSPPEPGWSLDDYLARFDQAKAAIAAGDIYQLNLTLETRFAISGSPLGLYRVLRQRQRVAYGAVIETGTRTVLSVSPELFLAQSGRAVITRPMKGTAPRAVTLESDNAVKIALASDAKSRAENLMIVDLMRNDLGRIAELGSVDVPDLFTVETLRTLHQMTSGVTAQLRSGIGLMELLQAVFPPGSITGAPKIRAMEIIAELEGRSRGVYCGSIGWIGPDQAQLNVAIRTLTIDQGGQGRIGIGSGVVADSDGAAEYAECLLKMQFLSAPHMPFGLFETLLLDSTAGYSRLDRHLDRLALSAAYFGFRFDDGAARQALMAVAQTAGPGRWRVRLDLAEDGRIATRYDVAPIPKDSFTFAIARERADPSDMHLYHKTTLRGLYDRGRAALAELPEPVDELVFLNLDGAVTEGTITSVFVERDGQLLTPPVSAGLLPGVLRADLLAQGRAFEARLTQADLATGTVWLGNSLRGLIRARYSPW